jgi:hypothetical protein
MFAKRTSLCGLLGGALLLTGCASTPDPARICTSEWIEPRAERALDRIETRTAKSFRALRKAGAAYVAGDTPGPLTLLSLRRSLSDLEDELKNGQGTRDLRLLAKTCNDPDFISETLTDWLERQNLPSQIMSFLNATNLTEYLIDLAEGGEASTDDG